MTVSDKSSNITKLKVEPTIIPRDQHTISRTAISDAALKVLYRLKNAEYKAYLVGGGVRDILLGREPKDFDVVTDAEPEQIRELFRNCRLIGRRFRLAHVRFGPEIIEVSTFRAPHHVSDQGEGRVEDGRIIRDNVYGDIDDDVWRRDFTVNALFYNIKDFSIVDYVGGVKDLEEGQLKLIGDPSQRYVEDPVRMLRAVRFAAKLGLRIHPEAEKPISQHAELLKEIPPARLFEEMLKLFMGGCALETFEKLRHYNLFQYLFPQTDHLLDSHEKDYPHAFIMQALKNTDLRLSEGNTVTPAFLIAAFLWEPMRTVADDHIANGLSEMEAVQLAGDTIISRQIASLSIPRRFTHMARDIWSLQVRLKRIKKRSFRVLMHPKFRAAYDFLLLRAEAGESLGELVEYWTKEQLAEPLIGQEKIKSGNHKPRSRSRPRGRRNKPTDS
ncbi:MAG TPA: polynucleotide adenylyltransferase PcnB [Thiotrichaceae bacterium]|jgi:poly(A) polymerase|nr:polynucleotide adenylyltransferase PcnB [Thiotrichaceae bacterium]HIM07038.1 polynucleotide adenylyltransferase PcnB [Gammaproteobacteria bacterium]